ncbi:DUF6897 domain-containing protein [Acetivibrio straminisolvens]|uniref:Uncharacterized protein n=1 Tax=Acetivibrio straminisolvens JCM 21531 TaxID=1294263 RepID=W4V0K1_9FIRM|nr:hypothetical protein [Acetivibrio straminisolvens]GAE87005.1 hypothetical protein JCM21531_342 [Acetivibrio straminisolvens JCM 21531]
MDGYLKQYVGKKVVVYLSLWSTLLHVGISGLVSECRDGWIGLKRKNRVQHISVDKIYCFRIID